MLVVQIMTAVVLFGAMLVAADRWASRCTDEDPVVLAERRAARRAVRAQQRLLPGLGRRRVGVRRLGRAQPDPLPVAARPIETVAADLRRLSRELAMVPSGATLVRWKALWSAYDGVLAEAAAMLQVPQDLDSQPVAGTARDLERVRVLAALEGAGLVVRA
jgi:hypothetical protein